MERHENTHTHISMCLRESFFIEQFVLNYKLTRQKSEQGVKTAVIGLADLQSDIMKPSFQHVVI